MVVESTTDIAGISGRVLRIVDRDEELLGITCVYLASHLGCSASDMRALVVTMSHRDTEDFFTANDARLPANHSTRLARAVVERAVGKAPSELLKSTSDDPLHLLKGLVELVSAPPLPVLMLAPSSQVALRNWFLASANTATTIAMQMPALPIAIAVPTDIWDDYTTYAPEDRVKAMLRERAVVLPVLDREGAEQVLRDAGVEPLVMTAGIQAIVANGITSELAYATAAALAAPVAATNRDEDDQARSAAERFLFEFLELLPETAGRFELNASPGFRFRSREAEIDLLDARLRIAIEIDGYYHFRDPEGYRRDREKDWELTRHGFLVLRFLADDIIPRLEDVRDRILAAVVLRAASGGTAC